MFITQLSVFVENQSGTAVNVLRVLAEHGINICALSIADTADYGILRLIVDRPEDAAALLQKQDRIVRNTPVLAIPISDRPGGLAEVLQLLDNGGLSVEYMYAFVGHRSHNQAVVITKTGDQQRAATLLTAAGIQPLDSSALF